MKQKIVAALLACVAQLLIAHGALAAGFPDRPVKLVVPTPPGGPPDIMARLLTDKMSAALGQPVIVENRAGGAAGMIGAKSVLGADADGYTLLMGSTSTLMIAPLIYKNAGYGPESFAPVAGLAESTELLTVSPSIAAHSAAELVSLAKSEPGKLRFGSAGVGSLPHLEGELLKARAHIDIVHVPYRGTVAVLPDLISGRVVMMIDGVPAETKNIQNGVVRALAVTTATRSPSIPDVPTMREVGLDYEVPFWTGLYAPIRTPQAIIDKLTAAANQAMHDPAVTKRLGDIGTEGVGSSPAVLDAATREQFALYRKIVRDNPALLSGQ